MREQKRISELRIAIREENERLENLFDSRDCATPYEKGEWNRMIREQQAYVKQLKDSLDFLEAKTGAPWA